MEELVAPVFHKFIKNMDMLDLFIWAEGYHDRYVKKVGLPISFNFILMEPSSQFFKNPDAPNHLSKWDTYDPLVSSPPLGEYKLPSELYVEVRGNSKIDFDFLPNGEYKFVSENFLNFLLEYSNSFEICKISKFFNRKRVEIPVKKQYYVIRYFRYDDDLIDFNENVRKWFLYPKMKIKEGVDKTVFALYKVEYISALLFTEDVKKRIEELGFLGPDIYPVAKYPYVYKGLPDRD